MSYTISSSGFIGTGSSVISDYLKEYSDADTFDKFKFIYSTDGLLDLRYHLFEGDFKYESGTVAIYRFLRLVNSKACKQYNKATKGKFKIYAKEFIDCITQGSWYGCFADPVIDSKRRFFINVLNKLRILKLLYSIEVKINKTFSFFPFRKISYSINPDNFNKCAKIFLEKTFIALGVDTNKALVFNQLYPGNNPQSCFPFFSSPKAIVVDRDPRDLFLQYKTVNYYSKERQHPVKDVYTFIDLYKRMRVNQPYNNGNSNILTINFEDMIYNYNDTSKLISNFCHLKNHKYPKKYFNPEHSIANTQFFKRTDKYDEDIMIIEKELKDYLYNFDKYDVDFSVFPAPFDDNPSNPEGRKWKRQT